MLRTLLLLPALALAPLAQDDGPTTIPVPPGSFAPAHGLVGPDGQPLDAMMLRLRSGGILWGAIESHDPDTLTYLRLDNGGRVTLPWGLVDPVQEGDLRMRFGYVEVEVDEVLLNAHRIPLRDGTELVGLIVNYSEDSVFIKTESTTFPLPKERMAGPAVTVQVPALDIYTREELYQQRLNESAVALATGGPETAPVHLEIAEYCERILDFAHAAEHYLAAEVADPAAITPDVELRAQRAAEKAIVQAQVDQLADADRWRAKKKFDLALALVQDIQDRFPDSPVLEDAFKLRARIEKAQDKALREEVVKAWHSRTSRIANEAAREMGYSQALEFAQGEMSEEIAEAVLEDLLDLKEELTTDEVRQLFGERKSYKIYKASYGIATWFLGADGATAGYEEQDTSSPSSGGGEKDEARAALEEKIKRYIENSSRSQSAAAAAGTDEDPEEYWTEMSSAARAQWIRAYYAENGGDMIITGVRLSTCRTCAGAGGVEVIQSGGAGNQGGNSSGIRFVPCPTCMTIQYVRKVTYK